MTVGGFVTADRRTVEHGQFGGFPPAGDLEAERELADVLVGAAAERLLDGAQDVSDGGVAQALVEGVPRYGTGARVALPFDLDPFEVLFSESAARAVVAVRPAPSCGCTSSAKPPGSVQRDRHDGRRRAARRRPLRRPARRAARRARGDAPGRVRAMRPAVRRALTPLVPGVDRFGLVLGLLVLSYLVLALGGSSTPRILEDRPRSSHCGWRSMRPRWVRGCGSGRRRCSSPPSSRSSSSPNPWPTARPAG